MAGLTKMRGLQIALGSLDTTHLSSLAGLLTSQLAEGASFIKKDGSVAYTAAIAGVDPTQGSHLATKQYVDAVASSLDPKASCRVATTANLAALSGLVTIDGIVLSTGDRVLVKNQTDARQNGIYIASAGAWTRAGDADQDAEVTAGAYTFVEEGTTQERTGWTLATPNPIVVGTTNLSFVQFSGAGTYLAGNGLTLNGNTYNVVSGNGGIVSSAGQIALTLADATLSITASGLKLAPLASAKLLVGNGSNVATAVSLSGAVTMDNTGATTLQNNIVGTANIVNGAVTASKHEAITPGQFFIGKAAGNGYAAMSGEATMTESGVVTLATSVMRTTNWVTRETPTGAMNNVNTVFTLANTPVAGTERVLFNGIELDAGADNDYTISGNTITLAFAPNSTTDKIRVSYLK